MTNMFESNFQISGFQLRKSTTTHIIAISRTPVANRASKNVNASEINVLKSHDLLLKTQILFVTNANATANNQAIMVDTIFDTFKIV